ncbi:hypothetical protein DPMN_026746 [Dreissena polymorpha]|uniref:Uncharacterized protein n=1 Tax=Dreissena polymorpha TaxID=45954 RepID=A0A9D4REM4_DREPO|nr:hypothetical protein DPMN_026746 [Dreissena polymorpha]
MGYGLSDKNNWRVVLGEHVQGREDGTEQKLTLDKIVRHPKFVRKWLLIYLTLLLLEFDIREWYNVPMCHRHAHVLSNTCLPRSLPFHLTRAFCNSSVQYPRLAFLCSSCQFIVQVNISNQ